MAVSSQIFALLVVCVSIKVIVAAPYCAINDPKFKDDKKGFVYGIPATGTCPKSPKGTKLQYILPVQEIDLPPETAGDKNIFSVGLYDPGKFKVGVEDIKTFLQKNNLPGYVKFVIINSKDTECTTTK